MTFASDLACQRVLKHVSPPSPTTSPRLLNATQASLYLGFRSPELLKNIPVQPIRIAGVGVGRAPRWDRLALDRWLDSLSGLVAPTGDEREETLDEEFEAWSARRHAK